MSSIRPKQKLLSTQKTEQWYQENGRFIFDRANFYSGDRWEMNVLYQAAMGLIEKSAYKYVLNPYNTGEENLSSRQYPAQMRNYDIISPIIGSFVGEKGEKPFNHTVISTNSDAPNKFKEDLAKAIEATAAQQIVNELNTQGFPTGVPSKEVPSLNKVIEQHRESYNDKRAIFGQEALDYIKYDLNLKDKYQEAIYDWIVVGRTYSYKDIYKNDIIHQIVPPTEMWHGTSETGFIEDSDWAMRRTRYNLNNCIDRFHEVLTNDEVTWLEEKFRNGNTQVSTTFIQTANLDKIANSSTQNSIGNSGDLIDIFHMTWKSFRKYGILLYIDELSGQQLEMEIDESYVLNKDKGDISIEWHWENQTEELYILGDPTGECLYKYMRPIQCQRTELSNTSKGKLPYNGRVGYFERNKINSVVKTLLPYQVLFNIYHFRSELTLARNKDKIMLMPKGLLPEGWGTDKFLYFAEATGVAFFDETKPNAAAVLNAIKGIDMGLGNYVSQMRDLLAGIKMEAWDAIGMNRQRYGDVKASDGKGSNEQALIRSAIISSEMFRRFERLEESDLQGLLDYSKLAWREGKKGMYITSDGRKAWLNLEKPEEHLEAEYGIFAISGREEQIKLETARQYAFGWAQKGASPASTVLEVIDSNNISRLKQIIKKGEDIQQEMSNNQVKAEQEHEKHLEEIKATSEDKKNKTAIEVARISAGASNHAVNTKAQTESDKLEAQPKVEETQDPAVEKAYNDYILAVQEADRKKQELGLKAGAEVGKQRLSENKLNVDREKIASAERIAKENKNRYDK